MEVLCASSPGTSTQGTAEEAYDYLITYPDRATEIAIVAMELQDASVQRLDAAPPPQAAPAEDKAEDTDSYGIPIHMGTPGQRVRRKQRRALAPGGAGAAAGASSAVPVEPAALVFSPASSYCRADASNQFVLNFPVNSGPGVRLGQAITLAILALLIQGPFSKEDKTDHQEHRRQAQSAMLNVYSDGLLPG